MSTTAILIACGILLALEVIILLVFRMSRSRLFAISQRLLAGRSPESLDEQTLALLEEKAHAEHHRTIYRKLDLIGITFLLPGLASWGIITRRNTTPPLYCLTVSFLFWLGIILLVGRYIA